MITVSAEMLFHLYFNVEVCDDVDPDAKVVTKLGCAARFTDSSSLSLFLCSPQCKVIDGLLEQAYWDQNQSPGG